MKSYVQGKSYKSEVKTPAVHKLRVCLGNVSKFTWPGDVIDLPLSATAVEDDSGATAGKLPVVLGGRLFETKRIRPRR